jgi:nicotinate phosphoribosyltransferase
VTLLVDTYDTLRGVRNAIVVAKERPADAVRLDSGDIAALAVETRKLLDTAGLNDVRIFASGGLDEYKIAGLLASGAPIDAFGVGTDLVTSADRPSLDIAYKLVDYGGRPVAKFSTDKVSLPGAKQVFRSSDGDVVGLREEELDGRPLLRAMSGYRFDKDVARELAAESVAALPERLRSLAYTAEPPRPRLSDRLAELARSVRSATSDTT